MKRSILTLALAGILTVGGTALAFADDIAQNVGYCNNGVTGVKCLVNGGLSFEEAKEQMLQVKFERVDTAVENGTITAERGEEIKAEMEENTAACTTPGENRGNCEGYGLNQGLNGNGAGVQDGTGAGKGNGQIAGNGQGSGNGQGLGVCDGTGAESGRGNGQRMGMRDGSCRNAE